MFVTICTQGNLDEAVQLVFHPGGESWNSLAIHRHIGCKCGWILSDIYNHSADRVNGEVKFESWIFKHYLGGVKTYEITIVGRSTGYGKYYVIKFPMFSARQSKLFLIVFDELMNSRQWTKNLALNWLLSLWMTSFPSNMCCWSPTLLLYHWHVLIACCAHDMSLRSSFSVFQPSLCESASTFSTLSTLNAVSHHVFVPPAAAEKDMNYKTP